MNSSEVPDFATEGFLGQEFTDMVFAWQEDNRSHGAYTTWQATHDGEAPALTYKVHETKQRLIEQGMNPREADRLANDANSYFREHSANIETEENV